LNISGQYFNFSKRYDPLHMLLRYLAEVSVATLNKKDYRHHSVITWITQRVPESDMVAVHDDDLVEFVEKICGNTVS
jgi:hypothetical protein